MQAERRLNINRLACRCLPSRRHRQQALPAMLHIGPCLDKCTHAMLQTSPYAQTIPCTESMHSQCHRQHVLTMSQTARTHHFTDSTHSPCHRHHALTTSQTAHTHHVTDSTHSPCHKPPPAEPSCQQTGPVQIPQWSPTLRHCHGATLHWTGCGGGL